MEDLVRAAGAVAIDDRGRLLVIQRGRPPAARRWSLPGGGLEDGERPEDAAVRELKEETGLDAEVVRLVGSHTFTLRPGTRCRVDNFAVRVLGGRPRPGDDATAVAWVTRSELVDRPTTPGLVAWLDQHGVEVAR